MSCPSCGAKSRVPAGKKIKFTCKGCGNEIVFDNRTYIHTANEVQLKNEANAKPTRNWYRFLLLNALAAILAFPIMVYLDPYIPPMLWPFNADRIILGGLIFLALKFILFIFEPLVIIGFSLTVLLLLYGTITNKPYNFAQLYQSYQNIVYSIVNTPVAVTTAVEAETPKTAYRPLSERIKDSIDYNSKLVRDFSHGAIGAHFADYVWANPQERKLVQSLAIFKEIRSNWHYVSDPVENDYHSSASSTILNFERTGKFTGDCDDYCIIMAAALKSIGAKVRLVLTDGHIYPELFIGEPRNIENVNFLINKVLFKNEEEEYLIHHHVEEDKAWLNLDYTKSYPGGPFMSEKIYALIYP